MLDLLELVAEQPMGREAPVPEDMTTPTPRSTIARLRHTHHMLARALAEGKTPIAAAAISGYEPSSVYRLQADPAFQELVAHYRGQVDELFASIQDRMGALGVSFLDEIQHRLENEPETFSLTQLRQMSEFLLDRSVAPAKGGPKGPTQPAAVSINIDFAGVPQPSPGPILELEPIVP